MSMRLLSSGFVQILLDLTDIVPNMSQAITATTKTVKNLNTVLKDSQRASILTTLFAFMMAQRPNAFPTLTGPTPSYHFMRHCAT